MIRKVFILTLSMIPLTALAGVGSFQMGAYTGFAPDFLNLSHQIDTVGGQSSLNGDGRRDAIEFYDNLIAQSIAAGNATGKPVGYANGAIFGVDFRYVWKHLFFRIGADYAQQITGKSGSLVTSTGQDSISYSSFQASFPVSIGISHFIADYYQFYIGFGPHYSIAHISVKHSDPAAFEATALGASNPDLIPYKEQTVEGDIVGFHLLLGIQIPVDDIISISFDYMYTAGRTAGIDINATDKDGNTVTTADTITIDADRYILGVQYLIEM